MPFRDDPWPAGTPCWMDISVPDIPAALAFYGGVLRWTFVDTGAEYGGYHIAQVGGRAVAGIGSVMQPGDPTVWTMYLASDDVDASAKLVTGAGGSILFEPMDIPGNGRMTVALDTAGAAFGIWQQTGMIGIGVYNEPGAMVWEDARLTDPDTARAFYTAVFGYTYDAVEGAPPDYQTFKAGGDPLGGMGGMMGMPDGTPSHWAVYLGVVDVDVASTAVTAAGGTVHMPPADTPFGRMANVSDPFGATFMLHQAPA